VGVEDVTPNFNVNLICGRWKCAYLGCIVEVSNILLIKIFMTMAKPETRKEI
jgi:hypothetical protein